MSVSPLKQYINRSLDLVRRNTAKVIRNDLSANQPPLPIFSFDSSHPPLAKPEEFALGSDADIGGLSTAHLTPVPAAGAEQSSSNAESSSSALSHIAFHGNLSLEVPQAYQGRIRTGYAAFRNKTRPTLFGEDVWDLSLYTHIKVVVAYRGLEAWRDKWMCNIQTDGPVRSDLFQHRLVLPPSPSAATPSRQNPLAQPYPSFHTLHLPISSFILTNSGQTADKQIVMMRHRVRTVGFALLGGGRSGDEPLPQLASGPGGLSELSTEAKKRLAAGGWGKGDGAVNVDHELEELLASDEPAPSPVAGATSPAPTRPSSIEDKAAPATPTGGSSSGYHRLGGAPASPSAELQTRQAALAEDSPIPQQGYYELCVKSIEAVRWDPEAEDGGVDA